MSHSQCPMVSGVRSLFRSTLGAEGPLRARAKHSVGWPQVLAGLAGIAALVQAISGSAILLGGDALSSAQARLIWALFGLLLTLGSYCFGWERRGHEARATSRNLGQYTLAEKLGEGGMGVVYKAHHPSFAAPMALKVLHAEQASDEAKRRFEREVVLTSRLTHPNTITIYDSGRAQNGDLYYAMEYLDGVDLETLVAEEGPQPPERVAYVLSELAAALAETHAQGLIHRDIKPANVMICQRGGALPLVKLVDFGLSHDFASNARQDDLDRVVGTPLYVSPEALLAPESMDGQSDLYSLGALGYFLLTGEAPFSGAGILEVCAQHLHARPVPPSHRLDTQVPARLERLILSCLGKSKRERPGSAAELYEALLPMLARKGSAIAADAA